MIAIASASLSADRAAVASGLDVTLNHPGEVVRLMRVLHGLVGQAIDEKSLAPVMEYFYANLTAAIARVGHVPVACAAGCSHCCHGFIAVTAPEAVFVATSFDAARLPQVRADAARMAARTRDKTAEQREQMVTPCPLLKDNLCTVYSVRPLTCRTGVSVDAGVCERVHRRLSGEAIPKPVVYVTMRRAYHIAFAGALKRAGLVYKAYEYYAALDFALNAPGAEADFLAGKDILKGLPEDIGSDPFAEPVIRQVYEAAFG